MNGQHRIVVTIHGIQTRGTWQKELTPYLAKEGLIPYHLDYGFFDVLRFLLPWTRESKIATIRRELRELFQKTGVRRVSVIAHSFGTLLAIEALMRDTGGLKFDRVVLTGSIVPRDFDWTDVIEQKKWVMAIRNERATNDRVVTLASLASRRLGWLLRLNAGDSGRSGFSHYLPALVEDSIHGNHSEQLNVQKFERWARFIAYPMLPADILEKVVTQMQAFRQGAASILNQNVDHIRINLFAPIGGKLRIVPGASDNMTFAPELDISIEPDHGATGAAFVSGGASLVVKQGNSWTGNHLPGDELRKVCPDLRWVLSLPVRSKSRGIVVGVINVDGLHSVPDMFQQQAGADCKAAMLALQLGMEPRFQPCLDAAFLGDPMPQLEI